MATRADNLATLAKLMEKIDIAMFTTMGARGALVSRPLSTQAAQFDGERVWFFTNASSPKVAEIRRHPSVNVAYASKDRNTYLSVSGKASVNRDQARIDLLWNDAMKAFFPGGRTDPDLTLIEVRPQTVEYWDGPGTWIGKALTFVVARVTGNDDVMGENRIVDMATGRSRKAPGSDRPPRGGAKKTAAKRAPRKAAKRTAKVAAKKPGAKAAAKRPAAKKTASRKPVAKKPVRKAAKKTTRGR